MSRIIRQALAVRDADRRPIEVGVVGAGVFGRGLVAQLSQAPGMRPAVVADRDVVRAVETYHRAGYAREDVVRADVASVAAGAIRHGRPVVVPDGALLAELPLEVVVVISGDDMGDLLFL